MNNTAEILNPSNAVVNRLRKELDAITASGRPSFVGMTYTNKQGETARYVINVGVKYGNTLNRSLEVLKEINRETLTGLEIEALDAEIASLTKSIEANEKGEYNEDYTKAHVYVTITDGLKVNINDGTFEISGMSISKKVIVEGTPKKKVVSRPLTIAKKKFRNMTPVSKFRTFCLDMGQLDSIRIGGDEIEVS